MKKNFFAGISILIPIVVTFWVVRFVLAKLTNPFVNHVKQFLLQWNLVRIGFWNENSAFFHFLVQVVIVLSLLIITVVTGYFVKSFISKNWLRKFDLFIGKIPLFSYIYPPIKRTIKLLLHPDIKVLKASRIIAFPNQFSPSYAIEIGLDSMPEIEKAMGCPIDTFLLPTAPNPLMGFILFAKKGSAHPSNLSVEETMKYMISLGLLHP